MESPQIYDGREQKIELLRGQLRNVSRAIANIQKMEIELRKELKALSGAEFAEFMMDKQRREIAGAPSDHMSSNKGGAGRRGAGAGGSSSSSSGVSNKKSMASGVDVLDREIRIFISSPFKDMQDERNQIVQYPYTYIYILLIMRSYIV